MKQYPQYEVLRISNFEVKGLANNHSMGCDSEAKDWVVLYDLKETIHKHRNQDCNKVATSLNQENILKQFKEDKKMRIKECPVWISQWTWKICTQLFVDEDLELMEQLMQTKNNGSSSDTSHNDLKSIDK